MRKILLLSAVAALAIAAPAVRLDEVSVSAQKIDENASEVAAAVSVLDEKELRLREAKDLNGLRSASSNLSFLQGGGISSCAALRAITHLIAQTSGFIWTA